MLRRKGEIETRAETLLQNGTEIKGEPIRYRKPVDRRGCLKSVLKASKSWGLSPHFRFKLILNPF